MSVFGKPEQIKIKTPMGDILKDREKYFDDIDREQAEREKSKKKLKKGVGEQLDKRPSQELLDQVELLRLVAEDFERALDALEALVLKERQEALDRQEQRVLLQRVSDWMLGSSGIENLDERLVRLKLEKKRLRNAKTWLNTVLENQDEAEASTLRMEFDSIGRTLEQYRLGWGYGPKKEPPKEEGPYRT